MKYSNEQLVEAVKVSKSWADVYRALSPVTKPKSAAGMQAHFKRRAAVLGLDSSHFKFQRKGKVVAVATPVDPTTTPPPVAA